MRKIGGKRIKNRDLSDPWKRFVVPLCARRPAFLSELRPARAETPALSTEQAAVLYVTYRIYAKICPLANDFAEPFAQGLC